MTTTRNAIYLCADSNMLIPALFVADAARSRSAGSVNRYDIVLFAEPAAVTETHRRWMEGRGIAFHDDFDATRLRNTWPARGRITEASLIRLIVPEYLAGRYDKLLYLDADISIHGDIGALFSLDTGEFALAAAPAARFLPGETEAQREPARRHFRRLGMTEPYRFVNSGVLLINVAKWNRDDLGERTLSFIRQNPELCKLPDEDGLNATLNGRLVDLSPVWNMRFGDWVLPQVRAAADPIVIHYDGLNKPWKRYHSRRRLFADRTAYRMYEAFLRDTPWPDWLAETWTFRDLRRNLLSELHIHMRRLRRKRPIDAQTMRRAEVDRFLLYWREEPFADVMQGIVTRDAGRLRLKVRDEVASSESGTR